MAAKKTAKKRAQPRRVAKPMTDAEGEERARKFIAEHDAKERVERTRELASPYRFVNEADDDPQAKRVLALVASVSDDWMRFKTAAARRAAWVADRLLCYATILEAGPASHESKAADRALRAMLGHTLEAPAKNVVFELLYLEIDRGRRHGHDAATVLRRVADLFPDELAGVTVDLVREAMAKKRHRDARGPRPIDRIAAALGINGAVANRERDIKRNKKKRR